MEYFPNSLNYLSLLLKILLFGFLFPNIEHILCYELNKHYLFKKFYFLFLDKQI